MLLRGTEAVAANVVKSLIIMMELSQIFAKSRYCCCCFLCSMNPLHFLEKLLGIVRFLTTMVFAAEHDDWAPLTLFRSLSWARGSLWNERWIECWASLLTEHWVLSAELSANILEIWWLSWALSANFLWELNWALSRPFYWTSHALICSHLTTWHLRPCSVAI